MTTTPGYTVEALLQALSECRTTAMYSLLPGVLTRAAELTQVTAQPSFIDCGGCGDAFDSADCAIHNPRSVERASPAKDVGEQDIRLFDSQWVNVVNHDNCYRGWTMQEAVNWAVRMTEQYMRENITKGWPKQRECGGDDYSEQVRKGVAVLKQMAKFREPEYELPADSFLEKVVCKIMGLDRRQGEPVAWQFQDGHGDWQECSRETYEGLRLVKARERTRALYAAPPATPQDSLYAQPLASQMCPQSTVQGSDARDAAKWARAKQLVGAYQGSVFANLITSIDTDELFAAPQPPQGEVYE